jgi:hypothetical protein
MAAHDLFNKFQAHTLLEAGIELQWKVFPVKGFFSRGYRQPGE